MEEQVATCENMAAHSHNDRAVCKVSVKVTFSDWRQERARSRRRRSTSFVVHQHTDMLTVTSAAGSSGQWSDNNRCISYQTLVRTWWNRTHERQSWGEHGRTVATLYTATAACRFVLETNSSMVEKKKQPNRSQDAPGEARTPQCLENLF